MALSFSEKTTRMLRLLLGTRYPAVLAALQRGGFTRADLDEGWALLRVLGVAEYYQVHEPEPQPDVVAELDAWENRWYPIVRATLERHDPSLASKIFHRLSQTSGVLVLVGVMVFLDRIRDLETGAHGKSGEKARRLLARRGLTDEVVGDARRLLDALKAPPLPPAELPPSDRAAELEAMWAWYREWSQILRAELDDGRLLRSICFASPRRRSG